jgi:hypothetical protein
MEMGLSQNTSYAWISSRLLRRLPLVEVPHWEATLSSAIDVVTNG